MIEKLYRNKEYKEKVKAVTPTVCNRCLGHNIYQDVLGQYYCLDCFEYGEVNDQMTIYRYQRDLSPRQHLLETNYQLSDKQKQGAAFLQDCYYKKQSAFLQAVCGAGKTEMTYEVILDALNKGDRVCFIIPRVAVIKELYKRFKKHFYKTEIGVLYEGKKQYETAALILSTPQQLIYFYQEFDLVIVDEVDAFPFAGNRFLERLVEKSLKTRGVVLYMSATINKEFETKIKKQNLRHHLIASRFHGRALAVPEFRRIKSQKQLQSEIIKLLVSSRQTLLFVPTIKHGDTYQKQLRALGYSVQFISSWTDDKRLVINSFKRGEFRVLICTTILERGVTFSNIDCVVVNADHQVFSKETLIQITGRVGRLYEFENGKITLYSQYISKAMTAAKKEIIWMNKRNEMSNL